MSLLLALWLIRRNHNMKSFTSTIFRKNCMCFQSPCTFMLIKLCSYDVHFHYRYCQKKIMFYTGSYFSQTFLYHRQYYYRTWRWVTRRDEKQKLYTIREHQGWSWFFDGSVVLICFIFCDVYFISFVFVLCIVPHVVCIAGLFIIDCFFDFSNIYSKYTLRTWSPINNESFRHRNPLNML